ncbi:hypothetical protein FISHEDRAFT_72532 [Fistulina hepatica ATCC 64428]|uniref:Caffeine-induced death protein 2 n=1 Tax=Fistulina hepatica ATCC 64428 TaxID=1128425 RepID=A0A0D7AG24_9AGAR|nr:hypothetical protein FISHEDRAFT_73261 [Fistulina hepatica ATCC 64428]KIY49183.1 hypothetical protein FISHEDRAFT_72532 [Fistulina hepatica ATCC 64428]
MPSTSSSHPGRPPLGSLAVQAPSLNPKIVSPSTCHNLSMFKELLNEYRKLDDTINMRINRANAAMRDQEREGWVQNIVKGKPVEDQACELLWRELLANWKRRTTLVDYCISVVDDSLARKEQAMSTTTDPSQQRKIESAMYSEQVLRNQVRNQLTVENIVRQRSRQAFLSRCRYFVPPKTDEEARKMWDSVQ